MNVKKLIWIPRLIAAIIMLQTLYFKFTAAEESVYIFSTLHMEPWGRIGTGIGELIASILILIPAVSWMGAGLAVGLMSGAIFFHLTQLGIEVKGDDGLLFFYACFVLLSAILILINDREKLIKVLQTRKLFLLFFFFMVDPGNSNAQGCSDAGICTVGASSTYHTPAEQSDSLGKPPLGLMNVTASLGIGEQNVINDQLILESRLYLLKGLEWQLRVPLVYNCGKLASIIGVGDISSALTLTIAKKKDSDLKISGGIRIPVGETNLKKDGRSLPMPYQTGLGTTDLLTALSLRLNRLTIAGSGQFVLNQSNDNEFSVSQWQDISNASLYFNSRKLHRGNDLSLRGDFRIGTEKKWLMPGVLLIYRLKGDSYLNDKGERIIAHGSEGLTTNLIATGYLKKSERNSLMAQLGFPIIVRKTRADGLTRSAVFNLTYIYNLRK